MGTASRQHPGIVFEDLGDVGTIRLARPPVNALDAAMLGALGGVFRRPHHYFPDARALVLVANGPHFSAGHDRSEAHLRGDPGYLVRAVGELAAVRNAALPVVAGVQGGAIGTGLILAASADLLFIDADAFVALPEVELGMVGGAGHAARWFPPAIVAQLVLTGERVSGATLHRAGAALAPPEGRSALEAATMAARTVASRPKGAVAEARRVLAREGADAVRSHREEMRRTAFLERSAATSPPARTNGRPPGTR